MFEQFGIINPWIYIAGAFMIVIAPGPNSLYVLKTSVWMAGVPAARVFLPY